MNYDSFCTAMKSTDFFTGQKSVNIKSCITQLQYIKKKLLTSTKYDSKAK